MTPELRTALDAIGPEPEYTDAELADHCADKLARIGKYLHHAEVPK